MKKISATLIGPTENQLQHSITSKQYEKMENRLRGEILQLINLGVNTFYVSGMTGVDATCAQLVIYLRDRCKYDIKLFLVITSREIIKGYSQRQTDDFHWIKDNADLIFTYDNKVTRGSVRRRNRFVAKRCRYLVAVWNGKKRGDVWRMIKMSNKKCKLTIFINQ